MDEEDFYVEDDEGVEEDCSDDSNDDFGILEDQAAGQKDEELVIYDGFSYKVLTPEAIASSMLHSLEEVNEVFQIPPAIARGLLSHFRWDKEKLLERFYSGDQEQLFSEAHVANPYANDASSGGMHKHLASTECSICFLNVPREDMNSMTCKHSFCTSCWRQYLTTMIMEEGEGQRISCPSHGCDLLVDELTVSRLLNNPTVQSKYNYLIAKSFVESSRLVQWCPAPGCNNAVQATELEAKPVQCSCGHRFCFKCLQPVHDPVTCHLLKKWLKKCDDDSETANWISANTKECPKCHVTIEKNGGCNHILCRNQTCKAEFCWVCLGPWDPHGSSWYNCNRYDVAEAKGARDAQAISRALLERYLFYCNRYTNHHQSEKLEKKLHESVKAKMDEMQQFGMSWIEVQFLAKAVDVLSRCRNVLKYTYVFAFYLKKNNQADIFLDNQGDLEMATETLSEYLEREISQSNLSQIKQQVQDKLSYCEKRRQVLLAHVYEGYDKDLWLYSE